MASPATEHRPAVKRRKRRPARSAHLATPAAEDRLRVELADLHVEVAALCAALRIRALSSCGPAYESFGYPNAATIGRASILVDPASMTHLLAELLVHGWTVDADRGGARLLPSTRVTLTHPDRSCRLFVYYLMPASHADPEEVFDTLWERRCTVMIGTVAVPALDRVMLTLLVALDRSGQLPDSERAADGLEDVLAQMKSLFTDEEAEEVLDTAARLHATTALHGLFAAWGRGCERIPLPPEQYAIWRLKVDHADPVTRGLLTIVETPPGLRMRIARQCLHELGGLPGPIVLARAIRTLLTARARLRSALPADPRASGWALAGRRDAGGAR